MAVVVVLETSGNYQAPFGGYTGSTVYGKQINVQELNTAGTVGAALSGNTAAHIVTLQSVPGSGACYYTLQNATPAAGNRRVLPDGGTVDIAIKDDSGAVAVPYVTIAAV